MRISILFMVLALTTVAVAKEKKKPYNVSSIKERLLIYHDGKGHYFAIMPPVKSLSDFTENFFYGNGKEFYRQRVPSSGRNGSNYSCTVTDPRVMYGALSSFAQEDGKVTFSCEKRKTALRALDPSRASKMLDRARFYDVFWQRVPHALARDSDGRYYYVDRLRGKDETTKALRGFRVFMGMRGKMKQLRMKNVVSDVMGEIFITQKGRLKLILDKGPGKEKSSATWISGEKKRELTRVPVNEYRTRVMIYRELGVYLGQRLQKPCDDL
jgi:hypothetical protein